MKEFTMRLKKISYLGGFDLRAKRFNTDTWSGREHVRRVKRARRPFEVHASRMQREPNYRLKFLSW